MSEVKDLLKEIKDNLSQVSSSVKDEERVMRAMLNDKEYSVNEYSKSGIVGTICPYEISRDMISSILVSTTGISSEEADKLSHEFQFKKNESQAMVNISKEFFNTYIETGRKISLGGREKSNISFSKKEIQDGFITYPKKIGIDDNGKGIYENAKTPVKGYTTIKVHNKTPDWV